MPLTHPLALNPCNREGWGRGIGNESHVHIDIVHFGVSCQYCGSFSAPELQERRLFQLVESVFGGIRGAERLVEAYIYIHRYWVVEVTPYLYSKFKSNNLTSRKFLWQQQLHTYGLVCKASLWTSSRARVKARPVPLYPHVVSEVFHGTV